MDTVVVNSRLDFIVIVAACNHIAGELVIALVTEGPLNALAPYGVNVNVRAGGNHNGGDEVCGFIGIRPT